MARIRSLHPGQWTDENFVSCSPMARLLALGLRNLADDQGVFEWKPLGLKMQLFPADNVDVTALLAELALNEQVREYTIAGKRYGAIRNFRKWQRPEKPKTVHPIADDMLAYVGLSAIEAAPEQVPSATAFIDKLATSSTDANWQDVHRLPVVDQSATDPRKSPQRKEVGGRREELSLRSSDVRAAAPGKALGPDWPPDYRDRFWDRYPEKVAKPKALAKLDALARGGKATFREIMAGLDRYIAGKPADRQWCNPLTWLNQERWTDQPAIAAAQPSRHGPLADQSSTRRRTFTDDEWRHAVQAYQRSGDQIWNHITYDSTEPRAGGCKVPRHILVEYGYRPAEAQAA